MSAIRGARLLPRASSYARVSLSSVSRRATFSISAKNCRSEVIKESVVPVSVYNPDGKGAAANGSPGERYSIPVTPPKSSQQVLEETVTPLTDEVYNQLPSTLQKMTVKDKVVIITGYVTTRASEPHRPASIN
jgi:hypothetical protein